MKLSKDALGNVFLNYLYFGRKQRANWILPLRNLTCARQQLKTNYWSAGNFKKTSLPWVVCPGPRCSHVTLVSGYPFLTAVNWSQHGCPIPSFTQIVLKCVILHLLTWRVNVRTDDSLRNKISWKHRLPHFLTHDAPLCALRAREGSAKNSSSLVIMLEALLFTAGLWCWFHKFALCFECVLFNRRPFTFVL